MRFRSHARPHNTHSSQVRFATAKTVGQRSLDLRDLGWGLCFDNAVASMIMPLKQQPYCRSYSPIKPFAARPAAPD
jgi:hypothetical protein